MHHSFFSSKVDCFPLCKKVIPSGEATRIKQKPLAFPSLKKPPPIIDMSTNGQLVFTDVDKITFKGVGNASNAVIDTLTGKIGVGIDSPDANLHVVGNSYVSTNLELGGTLIMGTVNVEAQHSLEAVTATGNTTPLTIEFTNPTTSLVASGNVVVTGNVVAGYLYGDGSNITGISSNLDQIVNNGNVTSNTVQFSNATTGFVTTANVEVGGELTVSGNVVVDTNTLFVDSVNNRVGVGTISPNATLDVNGSTRSGYNSDTTSYFGRSAIGYTGHSDWASFAHIDRNAVNDYALLQNSSGRTILNCAANQKISFSCGDTAKMTMTDDGDLGIGTIDPISRLHAYHGTSTARMIIQRGGDSGETNLTLSGYHSSGSTEWQIYHAGATAALYFWRGVNRGYISYNAANNSLNFTGQHRTFIKDTPFTQAATLEGLIVSSYQNKYIKMSGGIEAGSSAITVNEALPLVSISTTSRDKKCFCVVSLSEDPETREESYGNFTSIMKKEDGDTRIYINSVGEGGIWVSNVNGPLEAGDYITTSILPGYGMKQDDDLLHNYTVAKITMDCDFNPPDNPVQKIKKKQGTKRYWRSSSGEETTQEKDGFDEVIEREELVNDLDEHGQIQWEDHPTETEKAYKIRHLDANGVITDEANAVHKAAFVGCTYHCG